MIAGLDGYRGRWVAAFQHSGGGTELQIVDTLTDLLFRFSVTHAVIDVPIGLVDAGPRETDKIARSRLGRRRASVFPAPLRPMLSAVTHREASDIRRAIEGKGASIQAASIIPLIRSIDALMTPELQAVVREGHPEVSFATMAGAPLTHSKRKPAGREERLALVERAFGDSREAIAAFDRPGALVDILDAYAMLWTARRLRDGIAESIPLRPEVDARGLRMEMVI